MSSGHQSFDVIELTVAHNNKEHAAASYAALYEKLQKYLFFYAFGYNSPSIYKRVEVLREIQLEYDQLEEEFLKERAALEAKYQKLYQAFYAKRCEIINGFLESDGDLMKDEKEKGIPNFWLTAMKNNDVIADEIFDKDEGALRYLKDIKWSKTENPKGFKLDFFFNTNPYFKNSVLTKVYHMIDEDEPILEKATGTGIEWYPGKCLTLNVKKEGNIVAKIEHCKSFFNFFSPPPVPARRSDIDDAIADKLKKHMEQDYDVGITIKDKIIPRAISWFTGDAQRICHKPRKDNEEEEYEDGDYNDLHPMRM